MKNGINDDRTMIIRCVDVASSLITHHRRISHRSF